LYRISFFGSDQVHESVILEVKIHTEGSGSAVFATIPPDCLSGSYLNEDATELFCIIDASLVHNTFGFHVPVVVDEQAENKSRISLGLSTLTL
jgi:hypothetical protein